MIAVKKQVAIFEELVDKSSTGRVRPWKDKKVANRLLALAYDNVDVKKAERLRECATWLQFTIADGKKKLRKMNCCRVRLCPICEWRRSLKTHAHVKKIMQAMKIDRSYAFVFLTLTVRNCEGVELKDTIDGMMKAWTRMCQTKAFRGAVMGWYRGMEITHNVDHSSSSFDTYHPHYHCVLAVKPGYFSGGRYIKHEQWQKMWQMAMRVKYEPSVDVRKVYGDTVSAVAEAAKYAVKDGEYIIPDDWDLTVATVKLLDQALNGRRFIAYGGDMKMWHKRLNLDDDNDGDLVHIEENAISDDDDGELITYVWHTGYNQYVRPIK